jgi:hypothetical protein
MLKRIFKPKKKTMQTILVTGCNGQLGSEMQVAANRFPSFKYIYTDVAELDICDKNTLDAFVKENAVDGCTLIKGITLDNGVAHFHRHI